MSGETYDNLAYDLRQKYAEIVGVHLERIAEARIANSYPEYFKALEDLFVVIKHKFKTKKRKEEDEDSYSATYVKGEKKKEKQSDLELYYSLRQNAINVSNDFENTFLGTSHNPDPTEIAQIEKSLREIEMFLFYVMDTANMFGKSGYTEGL